MTQLRVDGRDDLAGIYSLGLQRLMDEAREVEQVRHKFKAFLRRARYQLNVLS
ncbi:MAG TPA: hypothetical protein QGI07_02860 [Dehalococcoidia bacterium]|nr:hypothetical protein [Dehalococcoidia bacterium]MDP7159820.1 hypothetical protein [Dehalococcoidia bacterium]MDP7213789.1 hypothetical protein [Dehalococcoidia bacterium]HJM52951.1 hypothetical protein [Dehalococcoidia bacterium]